MAITVILHDKYGYLLPLLCNVPGISVFHVLSGSFSSLPTRYRILCALFENFYLFLILTIISLAQKGIEMEQPIDMIKAPYVLEFLGVPENKPLLESDLEKVVGVAGGPAAGGG